jgi:hypothetical protein
MVGSKALRQPGSRRRIRHDLIHATTGANYHNLKYM